MDYAFSLVKLETLSVEEFLKLDGDDGWLIGKNLIVCAECSANVFLRRGEKRVPHFAHEKFRENNEGCSKRVGNYNPDKIKRLRVKQSKYRVGYFQRRFEDYLYISILNALKLNGSYFVDIDSTKDNGAILKLEKISDSNFAEKIVKMRTIGKNLLPGIGVKNLLSNNKADTKDRGAYTFSSLANAWLSHQKNIVDMIGIDKFKQHRKDYFLGEQEIQFLMSRTYSGVINENISKEEMNKLSNSVLNEFSFEFGETESTFAAETIVHLLQKGAEPLLASLTTGAIQLYLSTEFTDSMKIKKGNTDLASLMINFADNEYVRFVDKETSSENKLALTRTLKSYLMINDIKHSFKPAISYLSQLEKAIIFISKRRGKDWAQREENIAMNYYQSMYHWFFRLFKYVNLRQTALEFYGDNAKSPAEIARSSIDSKRGYIYIASAPYLKDIWKNELKAKNFLDCVKIGYSDEPDRRKTEIAGNIGPSDSITIEDVWAVFDMQQAEKFIHRKLNRYRLSQNREIFGLAVEEAQSKVNNLIEEYSIPKSKSSSKGF